MNMQFYAYQGILVFEVFQHDFYHDYTVLSVFEVFPRNGS